MNTDIFERKTNDIKKHLELVIGENGTGHVHFDNDVVNLGFKSDYFYIKGNEVTKEVFILNSGMEHLILDRSMIKCTRCGRSAAPDKYKEKCGENCDGIFF